MVKVGEQIEVKILRVDADERKIGLSRKRVEWAEEDRGDTGGNGASATGAGGKAAATSSAPAADLKGGVGGASGPLIKPAGTRRGEKPAESAESTG